MKKITILISLFLFFLLVSLIPISNVVKGTTSGLVIMDWDNGGVGTSFNLGSTLGSNGYMTFKVVDGGAGSVVTTGALSGKCMRLYASGVTPTLYCNLTTVFPYISKISIWIEASGIPTSYISFFNDSGMVAYIKFDSNHIRFFPVDTAVWTTFSTATDSEDGWINITHVSGNLMNYTWWNEADGVTEYLEGASYVTGDWSNITRIQFDSGGDYRVDNIVIDTALYGGGSSGKRTVNIRFIDDATGNSLGLFPDALNYLNLNGYIDSDLLDSPVNINSSSNNHFGLLSRFSFNNWVDGTIHSFDVTDAYTKKVVEGSLVTMYYDDYHLSMTFTGSTYIIQLRRIGTSATGNETIIGDDNGNNSVQFRFTGALGNSFAFLHFGDYGALYDDYPYVNTLYGKCLWWSDYVDNGLSYNLSSSKFYVEFAYNFTNGSVYNFHFYDLWSYTPYGDYVHFDIIWTQPIMHDGDIYTYKLTIGYYENKTTGEITDTMPTPVKPPIIPKDITDFIEPYKLYIGIGLVVGMTLIPFIVGLTLASKTNISVMDIPGLVYVSFFLIGITVSCVLGFFDLWVIFFVLFALILVFAITWIQGRQTGG